MGRHYDLARQMCNYWANFIRTGDPNGKDADGTDMPYWDSYTQAHKAEMVFTAEGPKPQVTEETDFVELLTEKVKTRVGGK